MSTDANVMNGKPVYKLNLDVQGLDEARRQISVCNACRYCEGFCAVFPAVHRQRQFSDGDITQLANLCHNCRGCYYACQYTEPHEFNINLPNALANVRVDSWQKLIWPSRFATVFQHSGVAIAGLMVLSISILFYVITQSPASDAKGFYAFLSHAAMVALFAPAFILPLIIIAVALRRYWKTIGGTRVSGSDLLSAVRNSANLKNLNGGQGQGCNFEDEDRYSNTRRWLHQATMYGFLLCFASTSVATLMHYVLGLSAPYSLFSLPKLLGIPGGILLTVGCAGLAWLKTKADPKLGATHVWGGEMAFILLLGATGLTGLLAYAATGTALVSPMLAIHLGFVLSFFLLMPYSKMVHGFFRFASLVRDSQAAKSTK
jgi:citrate/tricarballylate utilization protein